MGRTGLLTGGAMLIAAIALAVALLQPADAQNVRLLPDDAAIVAQGDRIYNAECASCHGANLEGQPNWQSPGADELRPAPPHDVTGHTWHHNETTLFNLTKYGLSGLMDDAPTTGMPAYANVLTDAEIIAVLSYIKSEWPKEIRSRHDAINDQAKP